MEVRGLACSPGPGCARSLPDGRAVSPAPPIPGACLRTPSPPPTRRAYAGRGQSRSQRAEGSPAGGADTPPDGPRRARRNPVQDLIEDRLSDAEFAEYVDSCPSAERRGWLRELAELFRRARGYVSVAQVMSVEELYNLTVSSVSQMLQARNAVLHICDAESSTVYSPVQPAARCTVGTGLVGRVVASGQRVHTTFGGKQQRAPEDTAMLGRGAREILCEPLYSIPAEGKAEVIGALSAVDKVASRAHFTAGDIAQLEAAGLQAAAGLQVALLRDAARRDRQQADSAIALIEALAHGSSGPPELAVRRAAEASRGVTCAAAAAVFLIDGESQRLQLAAHSPADGRAASVVLAPSIAAEAMHNRRSVRVAHPRRDTRFIPEAERPSGCPAPLSYLCAPVHRADGMPVGIIQLVSKEGGVSFTQRDERAAAALGADLAERAAAAQEHHTLSEEHSKLRRALGSLHSVVIVIGPAGQAVWLSRDPQVLLGIEAERARSSKYTEWFPFRHSPDRGAGSDQEEAAVGARPPRRGSMSAAAARRRSAAGSRHVEATRSGDLRINCLLTEDIRQCVAYGSARRVYGYCLERSCDDLGGPSEVNYELAPSGSGGAVLLLDKVMDADRTSAALGRFMGADRCRPLLDCGEEALLGRWDVVTVVHIDASAVFGTDSAYADPRSAVSAVQALWAQLGRVATECGGCVDRFSPDTLAMVFGPPHSGPGDASRACMGALRAAREVAAWRAVHEECAVPIGIGVATGECIAAVSSYGAGLASQGVGCGSGGAAVYGVAGGCLPTAVRLSALSVEWGAAPLLSTRSEETAGSEVRARDVDPGDTFHAFGAPLREITACSTIEPATTVVARTFFAQGLTHWRHGNYEQALVKFTASAKGGDFCAATYAAKCRALIDGALAAEDIASSARSVRSTSLVSAPGGSGLPTALTPLAGGHSQLLDPSGSAAPSQEALPLRAGQAGDSPPTPTSAATSGAGTDAPHVQLPAPDAARGDG
eukprot:TRINITY_DN28250_c0_g1_i1.p1 TRINITY_DN28250_c0_g1~~TRINITY_DN28250_c0_g1_i1.p1  ORF type:complete len:1033 (+),score=245.65 TRINITY_DN28250_c0_g1_i1:106-3099(+)